MRDDSTNINDKEVTVMKAKLRYVIAYILLALMLFGCSKKNNATIVNNDAVSNQESINSKYENVVEPKEYYRIIQKDSLFYARFYDDYGTLIKEEGPLAKMPTVTVVGANLIKFTVQAGTGVATQWGYYYDTENLVFSDVFEGIFDESENKVACVGLNKVIVSNIFDSSKYYKEFSEFSYPFSQVATPITNIEFSQDCKSIKVSYLTGEDYEEVTEVFYL